MKPNILAKYLATFAEPEAKLQLPSGCRYSAAIVVPVCGEDDSFLANWRPALTEGSVGEVASNELRPLVVVVINSDSRTPVVLNENNHALLASLLAQGALPLQGPCPAWLVSRDGYDILAIDRFSPAHQLPLKAGVGLARKIGGDIVSAWFYQGVIAHPWWLSTDADVVLPSDVLARLMGEPAEAGVACFPFEHTAGGDSTVDEATFAVEVKLRYHVLGMRYAGSPYAWHALGSCLMIHSRIYAAVRGFPKRLAGEDFYLLQKASKVGPILELPGEPMRIVARRSQRTPFGTGHEVSQLEGKVRTLKLRHPDSYTCLKHVLSSLEQAVQEPHQLRMMRWTNEMSAACASVVVALERRGAFAGWKSAMRAATTPEARRRRLHEWFDGLRSIQLLNVLESALPPLPWALALQRAPFVPGEVMLDKPPFSVLAARLRELEAIAPRMRG